MTGSYNLASLSKSDMEAMSEHRKACLDRWEAAQKLASAIYSMRGSHGWRLRAERLLAASPELEAEARKALNRMMKK